MRDESTLVIELAIAIVTPDIAFLCLLLLSAHVKELVFFWNRCVFVGMFAITEGNCEVVCMEVN